MAANFFNPRGDLAMQGSKIPHWQQGDCPVFVTFRLNDSLPADKLAEWSQRRERWIRRHPEPWSDEDWEEYHERFSKQIEKWLDAGYGECLLRESGTRGILADTLLHDEGKTAAFISFIIMPNHVHLLFRPLEPISRTIKVWKGVSARRIGKGSIWMSNYRDTLIRDGEHLRRVIRYIRKNPRGLEPGQYTLWESAEAKKIR